MAQRPPPPSKLSPGGAPPGGGPPPTRPPVPTVEVPTEPEIQTPAGGPVSLTITAPGIDGVTVTVGGRVPQAVNPVAVFRNLDERVNHTLLIRAQGRVDYVGDTGILMSNGAIAVTEEMLPRIVDRTTALVTVVLPVAGATVFADSDPSPWSGAPPWRMLRAGEHMLVVKAPGYRNVERAITVVGGVQQTVTIPSMEPDGGALGRAFRGWRGVAASVTAVVAATALGAWLGGRTGEVAR